MKKYLKIVTSVLVIIVSTLFADCKKESIPIRLPHESKPVMKDSNIVKADMLSGKEFIFNNLKWTHAGPGGIAEEEIWIGVENRPDLFGNTQKTMQVAVKFDTSSAWLNIPKWDGTIIPSSVGFVHLIMYANSFYVESYPMNFSLTGRQASLKIKFL